jgi:DNA-binding response OmpR family regulator
MPKCILVVDDEERIRSLLQAYLTQEGFRVVTAANGREALTVAHHERPDLIILDVLMPEMDGYGFMSVYTRDNDTPIILLTARLEETDKVVGLELGADDYVTKPFSPRELTARVRTVLRRLEKSQAIAPDILQDGDIMIDRDAYLVTVQGQPVSLTRSEFELLAVLLASPGRTFTRLQLLEAVQGSAFDGIERTIDIHVKNLRAKIEPDPHNPIYVETVYGVGYRFHPARKAD